MKTDAYEQSGVNIDLADTTKKDYAAIIGQQHPLIHTLIGGFAAVIDPNYFAGKDDLYVLKMEEPGSKQILSAKFGYHEGIARDLVHHLINDVAVTGASPVSMLDAIIFGKLDKKVATELVQAMTQACLENDCYLVGGETSEQPGMIDEGRYVLSGAMIGNVGRTDYLDGSRVKEGDVVIAISSNGPHTNGYSLIRKLIQGNPEIMNQNADGELFSEAIMKPHTCYLKAFRRLRYNSNPQHLHALAHITGGGLEGNIPRVIPKGLFVGIHLSALVIPRVFDIIRNYGAVNNETMLKTFNLGVGAVAIVDEKFSKEAITRIVDSGPYKAYAIGGIFTDPTKRFELLDSHLNWRHA